MPLARAVRAVPIATLLISAACSSNELTTPIADEALRAAAPAPAQAAATPVISTGSFYSYTADNDGLEYWDNPSIDGEKCNVGFFAQNDFGPDCKDEIGTPDLTDDFKDSEFLAGLNRSNPVPFRMAAGRYRMQFLGGYRGNQNEPFGFVDNGLFVEISTGISATVGSVLTAEIGSDFAFYVTPLVPINSGDNCGANGLSNCSDDANLQQFALFKKADAFLLGVEDRPGVPIGTYAFAAPVTDDDRDYNDFFVRIETIPETETVDGRMTGGLWATVGAGKIPVQVSMTIHCDNKLSNNLSVSWGDIRFQMDKNGIANQICSRTDPFTAGRPATDMNVFSGIATGMVGKTPATLEFSFTDNGERKGAAPDQMDLVLTYGTATPLTTGGSIPATGGNIQSHYDQPHRPK